MKRIVIFTICIFGLNVALYADTLFIVVETHEQRMQRQLAEAIAAIDRERMQRAELEGITELLILAEREDVDEIFLRSLRMDLFRDTQELFRQNQIKNNWMWTTAIAGTLLATIFGTIWFIDYLERNESWHDPIMNRRTSGGLAITGIGLITTGIVLEINLNRGRFNLRKMETQINILNNVLSF